MRRRSHGRSVLSNGDPLARRRTRRGVALVIALIILAVLSLLGAPFAASMLLRRRQSMRASTVTQLRNAASDLRNRARVGLRATHEDSETREFDDAYPPESRPIPGPMSAVNQNRRRTSTRRDNEPSVRPQDVDSTGELTPEELVFREEYENGLRIFAQGVLSDEQGKVDVATASFLLLGNLVGSSHLAEAVEADDTRLPLTNADAFPSDGDRYTRDGLLVIYSDQSGAFEAVTYRSRMGNELFGVDRGELLSIPQGHAEGSLVMDARALKIFLHRFWGTGRPCATLTGIRQINDWSLVRFFVDQLWQYHLTAKDIPRMKLLARLLGSRDDEIDMDEVQKAEEKLLNAGFDRDLLDEAARVLGEAAVCSIADSLHEEDVEKLLKELKTEIKRDQAALRRGSRYLRESASRLDELLADDGLEAFTALDLERYRDILTVHAQPVATWSPETAASGYLRRGAFVLSARSNPYLGQGSIVRLQGIAGGNDHINLVTGQRPFVMGPYAGKALGSAVLTRRVPGGIRSAAKEGRILASARLRSPVNINTAPYSVLVATLKGVQLKSGAVRLTKGEAKSEPITEKQARALAGMIWGRVPLAGVEQLAAVFREAQENQTVTQEQALALLINAVNPLSPRLSLSTCGFTFATAETYGLSVLGVARRGRTGTVREMARLETYEIFTVAPPGILNLVWDTQSDFSYAINLSAVRDPTIEEESPFLRAIARWTVPLPGRSGHLMMTYGHRRGTQLTNENRGDKNQWRFPGYGPGVLTGKPARLQPPPGATRVEHFDHWPDGEILHGGSTIELELSMVYPYAVDFFLSPLWEGSGGGEVPLATVTDGTIRLPGSTVTFSYDTGTNELLLRVHGGCRPDPTGWRNSEDVFVGVRAPLAKLLAPDTWYHVGFVVAHPEPGGQAIFLDGRLVGHGNLVGMSGGLAAGKSGAFAIEERDVADNLPAAGPLWVGDEIVYCQGRSGNRITAGPATMSDDGETGRGCRGSAITAHGRAPVRPVGYRVEIRPSVVGLDRSMLMGSRGAFDWITDPGRFAIPALPIRTRRPSLDVQRGGARLAAPLPRAQRVVGFMPAAGQGAAGGDDIPLVPGNSPESQLLQSLGNNPAPVPYTYPLIIAICNYGPPPQAVLPEGEGVIPPGGGDGPGGGIQPPGGTPPGGGGIPPPGGGGPRGASPSFRARAAEGGEGADSAVPYYPIDADCLPVPVDPRSAGFAEQGLLRIRYRFISVLRLGEARSRGGGYYDRIVEYSGIGDYEVPGDASYPAFVGIRDISAQRIVYHGEQRTTVDAFKQEEGALRQLRVYGISIPANGTNVATTYPPAGVIQIATSGTTSNVFPQLRNVEWIRYNYIYRNYFLSSVENRIQEDSWRTDPTQMARNDNNTVLRGFCGAVTPAGTGTLWAENFDPNGIGDLGAGREIVPVYWAMSALPGAGDGVWLSPRDDPERVEFLRVHKKAETDQGVFISFREPLSRNYRQNERPVIRRFPEPQFRIARGSAEEGGAQSAGRQGRLIIGPSQYSQSGTLNAIVDEVRITAGSGLWRGSQRIALRTGQGVDGRLLPEQKGNQNLSFFFVPNSGDEQSTAATLIGRSNREMLYALGKELVHVRTGTNALSTGGSATLQKPFMLVPNEQRSGTGTSAEGGRTASAAGAMSIPRPVFYEPSLLRERWPHISIQGAVPTQLRSGGYLVVDGFAGREIWSYERASGSTLTGVRKGVLGSVVGIPALHPGNPLRGRLVPCLTVRVIRGGLMDSVPLELEVAHNLGAAAPQIRVGDGRVTQSGIQGPEWRIPSGYVRVDDGRLNTADRIVAFVNGGRLILDEVSRRPIPNLTRCFGTIRGQTTQGSLINLPFRHYDRYVTAGYTHHQQHLTRALRRPGALWRRLSWEHGEWAPGARQRVGPDPRIHILVRFDGRPAWHEKPTNKPGGLYLFSDPVPKEGFPLEITADEIEVRIRFFYLEGSYSGFASAGFSDTWKISPRLRSLVLEYQDQSAVLQREEFVR